MKVLGIETATRAGGVALLDDDRVVAEEFSDEDATHSKRLLPSIDRLLKKAEWRTEDIDLVAVSLGPGSFTGLRIGLSAAKGIAVAVGAQIIGVPTLEAFAFFLAKESGGLPIWPVIDARKEEVYAAPFDCDGRRLGPDENISPEALVEKIEGKVILAGDGVVRYEQLFLKALGDNAVRPPGNPIAPRPNAVAELGIDMHRKGVGQSVESLAPIYVRAPDAVINPRPIKKPSRI